MAEPLPGLPQGNWIDPPVLPTDPAQLPVELPRGGDIPDDFDPLADGVLMEHQAEWLADDSLLKGCAKGRRTGITFAEALDATLIAAAQRSAGGQNYFYIPDTKPKGREFIGYAAHFAKSVAKELLTIEDGIFFDQRADGTTNAISSYIIRFKSGFRIEALSSRPENIRGLQGTVCIDEAAFHRDVREVIDSVAALLIWGGKVRIISSHNGVSNPFNELIKEAEAGKNGFNFHTFTFGDAVKNGLFKRVCLIKGEEWTLEKEEEWERKIRSAYGTRTAKMKQELDAIPAEAEGSALTRVIIERCMSRDLPAVARWDRPDDFKNLEDYEREEQTEQFCEGVLKPLLNQLDKEREHCFGEDFARSGDKTAVVVFEIGPDAVRRARLVVELKNIPFDQQRDILFYIGDGLPRMVGGALDARGNGQYLAEKARQRWGECIHEIMLSPKWYAANMPGYIEAFGEKSVLFPYDIDVIADHQGLAYVNGIIKVPDGHSTKGVDGYDRHGDTSIAGALAFFASNQEAIAYEYETGRKSAGTSMRGHNGGPPMDDDRRGRTVDVYLRGSL
ncbi:phage FluMu gp28-like protein [Rhizobium skierniewicense]|uniref:Phage FluMu gp28-like protein n=2 Tax=Rhizobium skierniewicense TaxID=984260 RepID=A0A7W6C7L6_9HYPH|nr:phage FluMu gp28-like protein [Rhizobium skierniewicense]